MKFDYLNSSTFKLSEFYGCFDKFDNLDQLKGMHINKIVNNQIID